MNLQKRLKQLFQNGIKQAPANVLNQVGMGAVTLLRTSDTIKAMPYFNKAEAAVPLKLKKKDYTPQNGYNSYQSCCCSVVWQSKPV